MSTALTLVILLMLDVAIIAAVEVLTPWVQVR